MGTSLFGLKPKNTYQALLKTTDNTAIDATLKTISDGLGTDTPLQLSTTETQVNSTLRIHTDNAEILDIETATLSNNRFNINRVVQNINLDFASKPTDLTTQVGTIRTAIDGVNLADVVKFQENGQVTFTERVKIESDSTVTTQTSSVIQSTTTDANLVIAPNGTGALLADIPDGTIAGGNARGTNAVDLQTSRNLTTHVASGNFSTISGGQNNTANLNHATVVGGNGNTSSGGYSVSGGSLNTSSGTYSVAIGGTGNTASANFSSAFGGNTNNATAFQSIVCGGGSNTASGQHSFIAGGELNTASANYSFGTGLRTNGYLYGQFQSGSGFFAAIGDAQQSLLTARREATLTTAATTVLSLDGTGVTSLIIPSSSNRAWNVQVNWVAVVTTITGIATGITVGDVITSIDLLAFKKIGGISSASTHTSTATKTMVTNPPQYAACAINYTAGASQEMAMTFTAPTFLGGGSVTMRVVARIELAEVAF